MRKLLLGLAAFGFAMMALLNSAHAQPGKNDKGPIIRDHRPLADLSIGTVYYAGDTMRIAVINRGGNGKNKVTTMRVNLYRYIDAEPIMIGSAYADIPLIPSGDFRYVSVRFKTPVKDCTVVGEIDIRNLVPEANEKNNRFSLVVK